MIPSIFVQFLIKISIISCYFPQHHPPHILQGGDTNSLNYFQYYKGQKERDFLVLCRDKSGLFFFSFLSLRVRKYNFTDVNQ